uniref:Peptidase A2 domain-containing protein n=1 Tax=Leptobrachium leishanense TaxID=445787 RepID=A0A8C5WEY4_9ANUR
MSPLTAGDQRPYVPLTVWWGTRQEPTKVLALVDTGAEVTVLHGNPSTFSGPRVRIEGLGGKITKAVRIRVSMTINKGPRFDANVLISELPDNILGIDVLLGQSVETQWGVFTFGFPHKPYYLRPVKDVVRGNANWTPVVIPPPSSPVRLKQYRLPGGHKEISETIEKLLFSGVIRPAISPFNAPVFPVKKSDGSWRLTIDYRGLNKIAPPLSSAVPDIVTIIENIAKQAGLLLRPIYNVTRKKSVFMWGTEQATAFQAAKEAVLQHQGLGPVRIGAPFQLDVMVNDNVASWGLWQPSEEKGKRHYQLDSGEELWQKIWETANSRLIHIGHVDAHVRDRLGEENPNRTADELTRVRDIEATEGPVDPVLLRMANWAHETAGHRGNTMTLEWARLCASVLMTAESMF